MSATPERSLTEIAPASGQKRSFGDRGSGPASKKAHIATAESADDSVQVKVLVPTSAAGAIIGKGGESMRTLKSDSGCKVQMSKNQDIYPGTNERICLVKGKISAVMKVIEAMMDKIREKVDHKCPPDAFDHNGVERNKEMKLLVPNTSAGMVIGKAGARIKEIRDATGANIQVYPKQGSQEAKVSQERVITIAADDNGVLMGAVQRVLEKVAADPLHANNSDITITGGGGGGMKQPNSQPSNMNMGGGGGHEDYSAPYHMQQPQQQPMPPPGPYNDQSPYRSGPPGPPPAAGYTPQFVPPPQYGGPPTYSPAQGQPLGPPPPQRPVENMYGGGGPVVKDVYTNNGSQAGSYKFNPMQGLGNSEVLAFLDNLQSTLRTSGFNEQAVAEVMQAMQVLAKYNIMGLGLGLGVASMAQMRSTGGGGGGGGSGGGGGGNGGYESSRRADSPDLSDSKYGIRGGNESLGGVLIDVMSQGNQKNQNFASSIIKERPQLDPGFLELEVPDAIVGAVLGQKAKTLQDIQHFSGAKVEVHKRSGNSTSGTRLITLSGDADHVRAGRVMIEQVINDEQNRRLHHQQRSFI